MSHHPPVSAGHAENDKWVYDIVSAPSTKFLGNSIEIYPVGERIGSHTASVTIPAKSHMLKHLSGPFNSKICAQLRSLLLGWCRDGMYTCKLALLTQAFERLMREMGDRAPVSAV